MAFNSPAWACLALLTLSACGDPADGATAGSHDDVVSGAGGSAGEPGGPEMGGAAGSEGGAAGVPNDLGGASGMAGESGDPGGAAGAPPADPPEEPPPGGEPPPTEDPTPAEEPPPANAPSGCPTNGPPPGPFVPRFDVATLQCNPTGQCSGAEDKCLCLPDFSALAALPGHFLAVSSDKNKSVTWGSGNLQAVYIDDMNTDWKLGGVARADAALAKAKKGFPCGVPKWFLVNEISPSMWKSLPEYRKFVIDFAKTMKQKYGKATVVAAPFQTVAANGESWTELAKYAFIGIESYLSGKEIKDSGFSLAWCQSQYAASLNSYMARGVPKSRLFLFEHFGNTGTVMDNGIPIKWGRQAVSAADWHKAIQVRSKAANAVGFAGFVSYDWGANGLHAPQADRLAFMKTYRGQKLP